MKYLDEFRDPRAARRLLERIRDTATREWVLMEVCGGQTHSLLRHGIDVELAGVVELIHGPGCPVCVTPAEAIDRARELAREPETVLATFGDMLRVPGSVGSLAEVRAEGGVVRAVYSPLDAVELARREPGRRVVFFAVGFETTVPATALAVLQADRLGLDNFQVLAAHVRVPPAMEAILAAPGNRVQAFLAAGHVCTVTGHESYGPLAERYGVPVVVTGFEPLDLLEGILECVRQLETGRHDVVNRYGRSVREEGNRSALEVVDRVYEVTESPWRGLGTMPAGGFRLRREWRRFDAAADWRGRVELPVVEQGACRAGEVLAGRLRPTDCEHFGTACTPESPLGAPMVSAEGACAAYHRYADGRGREAASSSGSRS